MKKIKIKDTTNEMSTTGTGASFTSGKGAQYASPKSFRIIRKDKKEGINSPFDTPSPSIPNRPSKAIDYKQLFQEMSKTASPEEAEKELKSPYETLKVGKVSFSDDGTSKSTITNIDPETGAVSWRIDQLPGYDKMFDELDDLTDTAKRTAQKSKDDRKFKDFYEEIRVIRNKVRTHLRKEHPEIYDRIQMRSESVNEAIDLVHVYDKDGKIFGTGEIEQELPNDKVKVRFDGNFVGTFRADRVKPVMEVTIGGSSRERLTSLAQSIGREEFAMNVLEIPDDNVLDDLVDQLAKLYDMRPMNEIGELDEIGVGVVQDPAIYEAFLTIIGILGAGAGAAKTAEYLSNNADKVIDWVADNAPKYLDKVKDYIAKKVKLNEARYSQFKKTTEVRTPTEQIHRAVREIRRKIDEISKVVGHTERMKNELKQSNEGMHYLKRTRNAINKISEKIQELNNRIKGLTE